MTTPYTYILKFIPTGQLYYGVRFKENCSPDELFKTYFSSSKVVRRLIADHGADLFTYEIRKIFKDKRSARDWEQRFLIKVDAASNSKFLNQSNNMKGILRNIGLYHWCYNPSTTEKLLLKKSIPVPTGFIAGVRGPDARQKGTIIITDIETGKLKRIKKGDTIPDGYYNGRVDINGNKKGTTTNTIWICNDSTKETRILQKGEPIPENWRKGNLNINNKGKIKIHKLSPYKCISIVPSELDSYLSNGWLPGNPCSSDTKIFKFKDNEIERKNIKKTDLPFYENEGWYRGLPVWYKIYFTNGEVLTYPYQWFVRHKGISVDMIRYAEASGGKSIKFQFEKVEKIT